MIVLKRRILVAAAATLASGLLPRKPHAATRRAPSGGIELPNIPFRLPDGTVKSIADYRGKGVVLNLWATWCVPCVAEMPDLDTLAAAVAAANVVVLPLSSDRGGAAVVERFYKQHGIQHLPILLDEAGNAARTLGVAGIPTTVLIDKAGRERARVEGGADWASVSSVQMIKNLAA